jgi:hypothetical protein
LVCPDFQKIAAMEKRPMTEIRESGILPNSPIRLLIKVSSMENLDWTGAAASVALELIVAYSSVLLLWRLELSKRNQITMIGSSAAKTDPGTNPAYATDSLP